MTKSAFAAEIFNGKIPFLCSVSGKEARLKTVIEKGEQTAGALYTYRMERKYRYPKRIVIDIRKDLLWKKYYFS